MNKIKINYVEEHKKLKPEHTIDLRCINQREKELEKM
jgi:hypothetical protein